MRNEELESEIDDLSSAEEFLDYFEIEFDPHVVMVNRLHILQRFHDYLTIDREGPVVSESWWDYYTRNLKQAYQDFVESDALTEKVFKVFQPAKPAFVPLEDLLK
ncbi:nitrogenase-stabilizing/protective protein NifW [uncultured Cohaesibacter sp.]|uniref:nitrogenase-stabilizing/protective protein NifW n=1 Tax=uncultured Cohaesibacter sp. TaxID=1002546 RepID=UPI0029C8895A|nr:nitrogenase-stabilizing/protective protein NifW [uncultured Cohaesibacter sp.]